MHRARALALVAVGGAAGAAARHAVALALPGGFPWGTLAVNVAGSFLLGLVVFSGALPPPARLAASTGFLSSFTTYSTFAAETAALSPRLAGANVAANYGLGLAAALAARRLVGERDV
jgi:CrcB protein